MERSLIKNKNSTFLPFELIPAPRLTRHSTTLRRPFSEAQ